MNTITIERELLEQALGALVRAEMMYGQPNQAVQAALRAELAKPVEPVEPAAWRTFDGEGGYMFRAYEDNEVYKEWWEKRNPHHKGWVEPLYLHPPTPAWNDAPEVAALKAERDATMKDAERLDYLQKHARCDPKMDGNHVWWPTTFNQAQNLRGETLRKAIDAAIAKAEGRKE